MNHTMTLHKAAAKGFQIAGDSYERGRPNYPVEVLQYLKAVLNLAPGMIVVDLGAGTGKFTRLLTKTAANIVAIEPVEGMRRKFVTLLPDINLLAGTAEAIPLADVSVETLVVAQAFHWFKGVEALSEIHRVLRPGGRLGLLWNVRDERSRWVAQLTEIIDPHAGDTPRYKSGRWRMVFDSAGFSPLQMKQFSHTQKGTPETVVDRVASISFISALPPHRRQAVLAQVRTLLRTSPMTAGNTHFELPYRTDVFWCAKI